MFGYRYRNRPEPDFPFANPKFSFYLAITLRTAQQLATSTFQTFFLGFISTAEYTAQKTEKPQKRIKLGCYYENLEIVVSIVAL